MYKLKYIDEISEQFETIEAYFGTVIHKVLEYAYLEDNKKEKEELFEYFEIFWEEGKELPIKIVRQNESEQQYIIRGKELLQNIYLEYKYDKLINIELEHSFQMQLPNNQMFSGKIDRIAKDEQGEIHLIDYKTSKKIFSFRNKFKALQIKSYGCWALNEFRLNSVYLHYNFLQHRKDINKLLIEEPHQIPE